MKREPLCQVGRVVIVGIFSGMLLSTVVRAEPLAAWEFDAGDVAGSDVSTTVGTAANTTGTLIGTASAAGGVLTLDGNSDYLQFGSDVTDLRNLGAMTIAAWVKGGAAGTADRRIVEHEDNFYFFQASDKFQFAVHGSSTTALSTTAPSVGTWQHVLWTYENGKPLKIYVNGVWEGDSPDNDVPMPNNVQTFQIGARRNSSGAPERFFNGDIDDVAIWGEVLPTNRIELLAGKDAGGYTGRAVPSELSEFFVITGAATGLGPTRATLNGALFSTSGLPTQAWVYWGTTDGGTNANQWAHTNAFGTQASGTLSTNVTGLSAGTTYYCRFYAENSSGQRWSRQSSSFSTVQADGMTVTDGLQLWLRADTGVFKDAWVTAAGDGDVVMQWKDLSGNDRHATRIGSMGNLTYKTAQIGGKPVIALTDATSGDYLRTIDYQPADDDDLTVFVVARAAAQTLNGSIFHPLVSSGDPASNEAFMITVERPNAGGAGNLGYRGRGSALTAPYDQYTSSAAATNFSDGAGHVIVLTLTNATGNGTFTGYYDGTLTETHDGTTSNPSNGPIEIGGMSSVSDRRFAGAFAEILIYDRALNAEEHDEVGWYLQDKYGLSGSYVNPSAPAITNTAATAVLNTTATLNGELLGGDLPATVSVYWGTSDGMTNAAAWEHTNTFGSVAALGSLSTNITGLTEGTMHYYRFFASNGSGTTWAPSSETFATPGRPIVSSDAVGVVNPLSATLRGTLVSTGGVPTQVWVYWGTTDGGTNASQWANTNAFGTQAEGALSTNVTGLTVSTTYHYRFFASSVNGGRWAAQSKSFITMTGTRVTDGLQLWLLADAGAYSDAGVTPAVDGDPVVQWNDLSGNDRHATRIGSMGNLTYKTAQIGGKPVIALTDASNGDYLRTIGYQPADDDDLTVFVVARAAAQTLNGSSIHPLIGSGDPNLGGSAFTITTHKPSTGGPGNLGYFGRGYNPNPYDEYTSNSTPPNFSDGNGHVIVLTLTGATGGGNGTFTGYYDGVEKETHAGLTNDPDNGPVEIGGSSSDSSRRFAGAFAEILIYDRWLNNNERNTVGYYLQSKYSIAGAYLGGTVFRFR